jgi:hypothetical protein
MKRVIALLTIIGAVVAPASASAAPTPAWQVIVTAYPTHFAPGTTASRENGPGYVVLAKNIGAAPTSGQFTVTDTVPAPLTVVQEPEAKPHGVYGDAQDSPALACTVTGNEVSCSASGVVYPGHQVEVLVPVAVPAVAPATVHDHAQVEGGGAAAMTADVDTPVTSTPATFDFLEGRAGAYGSATGEEGQVVTQAGSHPYQLEIGMNFNDVAPKEPGDTLRVPDAGLKTISGELPQGAVVDPTAVPKCTETQFESDTGCPDATQIGTVRLSTSLSNGNPGAGFFPLYNLVPPPGHPSSFGFEVLQIAYIHLLGRVRSNGDYGLSADVSQIPSKIGILGNEITLWGNPSDPSHDQARGVECASHGQTDCATPPPLTKPFLTLPSSCPAAPGETVLKAATWDGPATERAYPRTDPAGEPVSIDGCNHVQFQPTISSQATTNAGDSPSGLDFTLHQPQNEAFGGLATANLKNVRVTLPAGMALNPSAAGGLAACDASRIGLTTPVGQAPPVHFTEAPQTCPDAAKLGTVEVKTPLLDHPLSGDVYLAKPFENPFGSLLGIYLALEDDQTGIVSKLAGKVTPDAVTGQLTTTFEESPELPLEDIELHFFNGARAALTTPLTCGDHTTTSTLTPWSTPEGADASPSDTFQTQAACASSEGDASKAFAFTAGSASPLSGAYSPFVLRLSRGNGTQHITGVDTTLPEGLLGKIAGVAYCPEAGIAQAQSREATEKGKEEIASPSCPQASEVGSVDVAAGSGISPYHVGGHAYLAGPYKGAPLSLVVIVPAVAGPFDLGTVVTRVALNVGEYDARIHAVSDPLPTIRDGIPLDVRSIEVKLDRSNFTLNPSSCEAMSIEGSASTQAGQSAPLKNSFQVGECGRLAFKPSLKLSLKGPTKRTGHPALKAEVTYPKVGEFANIASAQVSLPHSEFLDQGNIGKACTKTVIAARACPASSIYGSVKAWTPLLEKPLEGPVYLVGGYGFKLPALVAELNGQIRVLLVGKIDTDKQKGIRNTFETVPDAPVSRFVLEMKGGKKYGLLENSEDICRKAQKAGAAFAAQNGKALKLSVTIANSCKGGKKKAKHHHKKGKDGKHEKHAKPGTKAKEGGH